MAFDPTKPVNSSKIVAAELRSQFNDLKSLIDAVPAGPVGPQGPAGAQGTQGMEGAHGDAGVQGAQGIQGPEGAQGDAGVEGAQGPKGDQGPAGAQGDAGVQGVQGETGVAGADGATGPQGLPGVPGAQGPTGAQGEPGPAVPETDPVFAASEAAQFVPGDKAKLDSALQPNGDGSSLTGVLTTLTGRNVSELTNDARYLALSVYAEAVVDAVRINDGTAAVNRIGSNGVGGLSIVSSNFIEIAAQGNGYITINDGSLRHFVDGVNFDYYATQAWVTAHTGLSGHNVSELTNDAGYVTAAYGPANPGHWAGTPPATVAEALDRLAAAVSGNGATLVP